jgi:hypothetical protein
MDCITEAIYCLNGVQVNNVSLVIQSSMFYLRGSLGDVSLEQ